MGWWGPGLLEGDPPMDTLCFLGDHIGIEDLYPLDFDDSAAAQVRSALEGLGESVLEDPNLNNSEALPVVAATYLQSGAAMPEKVKVAALVAIRKDAFGGDGWRDGGAERKAVMAWLEAAVLAHEPGKRVDIESRGLLETVLAHDTFAGTLVNDNTGVKPH